MQRQSNSKANNVVISIGFSPDYSDRIDAIIELHKEGIYCLHDVMEIVESETKRCLSIHSYKS